MAADNVDWVTLSSNVAARMFSVLATTVKYFSWTKVNDFAMTASCSARAADDVRALAKTCRFGRTDSARAPSGWPTLGMLI
jgi:hypothetical protein